MGNGTNRECFHERHRRRFRRLEAGAPVAGGAPLGLRIRAIIATIGLLSAHLPLSAQEACRDRVGKAVEPISIDSAAALLVGMPTKGEFESSVQFEARRLIAASRLPQTLFIAKDPEDRKFFTYDADKQRLRIESYAFANTDMLYWSAFLSAGMSDKLNADRYSNVATVISTSDTAGKAYEATNAYGAKIAVLPISRTTKAIFERKQKPGESSLFALDERSSVLGELSVGPDEARQLKPTLKIAFEIVPAEPYVVTGTHMPFGKPTTSNPREITERFVILIADVRCALLTGANGRVIAAFPTR